MKHILLVSLITVSLFACGRAEEQQTVVQPAAEASTLTAPALKYTERELPNGLRVFAIPDTSTANVSVHVWYDVGSKDDPTGRSGFAHLFEHIMFKSTRNMPAESFDRLTEDVGGFNNASTYDDFTNYFEVAPANHLQRILWAEAERMGALVIDEAVFNSERDVVKEELRQRVLTSPYGRLLYLYLQQVNYVVHPYGRPGIGSIEDLDAATVEDVRAFHATYYRPDNAALVVAGHFNEDDLNRWIDQYFAPISSPGRPIPRVTAVEPERTTAKSFTAYAPNVPLPAVLISYPGINALDTDLAALTVLDAVLSRGDSSRLYQSLVYESQIAAQIFTFFEATHDQSFYAFAAILSEGRSVDDAIAALNAEVIKLRDSPVSAAELDEAKNELLTEKFATRETANGRAFELAESVLRFGDAAYADQLLASIEAVSAEDVQRVARRIFSDERSVTIRYFDESEAGAIPGDDIHTADTIVTNSLSIPAEEIEVFTLAPEHERVLPPEPASPVSAHIPPTAENTLVNGMRVIVASKHDVPLISADLRFASGAGDDPAGFAGLASMTADLANKGTPSRSASVIAQQIEALGANLSTGSGAVSTSVSLATRSDRAEAAFNIFADVSRNPVFADEEVERARQQELDALSFAMSQPGRIASFATSRLLFGTGPYGGVATQKSLLAIDHAATAGFHAAHWRPENSVLVIAGDVTAEQGFALAEKYFADWTPEAVTVPASPAAQSVAVPPRTLLIDLPGSGQAAVYFGLIGPSRLAADYYPAYLATDVLGGGYSSRLNAEIRIKRGLSYGAFASLAPRTQPAPIIASSQTRNDAAVEVAALIEAELLRLGSEPVQQGELDARKAGIIGSFGRSIETTAGLAGQITTFALFGLPTSKLQSFVSDIDAIDATAVQTAAARYFDPANAAIVVVGDAAQFHAALKAARPQTERIAIDDLNLDSASLE